MNTETGVAIDRWSDPLLQRSSGWIDAAGRSPVALHREYLDRRREWEQRAWQLNGSRDPRFARALIELSSLHEELSTAAPPESRDQSVEKPPSRDHRKVRILVVDLTDSAVRIVTAEEEFDGMPPTTCRVTVVRVDDRWRIMERVADHGRGRRLRRL